MAGSDSSQGELAATAQFDGGALDCGSGLLLLIRKHIDLLDAGQLLQITSTESSVEEDLPAWCKMTGNELVSVKKSGDQRIFLVCKGRFGFGSGSGSGAVIGTASPGSAHGAGERRAGERSAGERSAGERGAEHLSMGSDRAGLAVSPVVIPERLPEPVPAPPVRALAVMGIGSWPRPRWLLQALYERLAGRISDEDFQLTADDAVRLSVADQIAAGVDVVSDGEQRRDNYASFVGNRLDNCQTIPLVDLLPLVDDPDKFEREMKALDVPYETVRHPVVFGRLGRSRSLALNEFEFLRTLTDLPAKVALPGPYLLTRTMWLECLSNRAYGSREELSRDIVRVLREEVHFLLARGVTLVQLDEPILSEVVFGSNHTGRTFMCGALSEKGEADEELEFAGRLISALTEGLPEERLALHVCRGNWTPDESHALSGDYTRLLDLFSSVRVGTLFLEFCTPRAGDIKVLGDLPSRLRLGVGVVNPKDAAVESVDDIARRMAALADLVDAERLLFTPDCGFATFADNPVASSQIARQKLEAIVAARDLFCK